MRGQTTIYNQPPNSILGGLHMPQTNHDFVAHERIRQSGHVVGGNGGLRICCLKRFWAWLNFFHSTFSNDLGGFYSGHSKHCAQG
jgi:hypothetical protein